MIWLENKKTGDKKSYNLYNEDDLNFLKATKQVSEKTEDGKTKMVKKSWDMFILLGVCWYQH